MSTCKSKSPREKASAGQDADNDKHGLETIMKELYWLVRPVSVLGDIRVNFLLSSHEMSKACEKLIDLSSELLSSIVRVEENEMTFENTFKIFGIWEGLFNLVCSSLCLPSLISVDEHARNTSFELTKVVDGFMVDVYLRKDLFDVFVKCEKMVTNLDGEDMRLMKKVMRDFIRYGQKLEGEDRARFGLKRKRILENSVNFVINLDD